MEKNNKKYEPQYPYNPTAHSLNTKCPVSYNWLRCSSKEYRMCCRTCVNYNPLRMLYEKESNPGLCLNVQMSVLLSDAKMQLEHED